MADEFTESTESQQQLTDIDDQQPLVRDSLHLPAANVPDGRENAPNPVVAEVAATSSSRLCAHFEQFNGLSKVILDSGSQLASAYAAMQQALDSERFSPPDSHLTVSLTNSGGGGGGGSGGSSGGSVWPETWLHSWHHDATAVFDTLKSEPRLIVFGGPGSGKSSLINRILGGESVLPIGCSLICQAGIIYLHYSDAPFVRFTGASPSQRGQREATQLPGDQPLAPQIRKFLQTGSDEAERAAWAELNACMLEIGASCPLLKTGLTFLEVPSDCVDPLIRERLLRELSRSHHRTVVYVIDSQKGFCNQDREFLLFLRANRPEEHVIFAANKADYDPVAEMMDRDSDYDDSDADSDEAGGEIHASGVETQSRKLRLVEDQLYRYRLLRHSNCGTDCCVFPVSLLRIRAPLSDPSLNQQYLDQYQHLESAIVDAMKLTGTVCIDSAVSILYLKSAFAFDAFARETEPLSQEKPPGSPPHASQQVLRMVTKDFIRKCMQESREAIERVKLRFVQDMVRVHQEKEADIVRECGRLEFGPLRLNKRIRNNEVELQYRSQINNYLLHLLNTEVVACLHHSLLALTTDLSTIIGDVQKNFTADSADGTAADSQWNAVVRIQAQEAQTVIAKMRLSMEWETDFNFIAWMKRLVSKKGSPSAAVFNSSDWKSSVAREFYSQINPSAVVRKFFTPFDAKLHQVEQRLASLLTARQRCGSRLRRLLRRGQPAASQAWRSAQVNLAMADALRNWQRLGPMQLCEPPADDQLGLRLLPDCRLGSQRGLRVAYGGLVPGRHSATVLAAGAVGAALTGIGGVCGLFLGRGRRYEADNRTVVAPLLVAMTPDYRLCVLHNAYSCSLRAAIESTGDTHASWYNERQAFMLLRSLLDICRIVISDASSDEAGVAALKSPSGERWSLQCDNIRVRFDSNGQVAALYDCLDENLQVTKKVKKPSRPMQLIQQQMSQLDQPRASALKMSESDLTFRRSRSQDVLAYFVPEKTSPAVRKGHELDKYLRLAFMILCRSFFDEAQLSDWPASAAAASAGSAAAVQSDSDVASDCRQMLADAAKSVLPSRFVIDSPWDCVAELAVGENRLGRIAEFIESKL